MSQNALGSTPFIPSPTSPSDIPDEVWNIIQQIDSVVSDTYFGDPEPTAQEIRNGESLADLVLSWTNGVSCNEILCEALHEFDNSAGTYVSSLQTAADRFLRMERNVRLILRNNKDRFPTAIWQCCRRHCFAGIAFSNSEVFEELKTIHGVAEEMHDEITHASDGPQTRRKGTGGSKMTHNAPTRDVRETSEGITPGSDRQKALRKLESFVLEVLPYLYAERDAPNGTSRPPLKLCTQSICCLLGVSRNFLYLRKKGMIPARMSDDDLFSIVDVAGIRLRQKRRNGDRSGYPSISDLPSYDCRCFQPCLAHMEITWLKNEYKAFANFAKQSNSRQKENKYLLNELYYPFNHSPINVCNRALSALYTVSVGRISDIRLILKQMCNDPSADHRDFIRGGVPGYRKHLKHPMNRYPDHIRDKIEKHLDMILRADPAGAENLNVCRVYSPEINTKEKLRKELARVLEEDESVDEELSDSTLQRMTDRYLKERKCTIVFTQNDHNACPICKTMNYAVLEYYQQAKQLESLYEHERARSSSNAEPSSSSRLKDLKERMECKRYQEKLTLRDFKSHLGRDASIRKTIKVWSDFFRQKEKQYLKLWRSGQDSGLGEWNGLPYHAIITHQDDMTKVDLPHFVVTVSADISRWRFDVNAHVSAVNDECIVFSHEQGTGAKNASSICEMVLLDHLLRCRGEGIKVVVSDNASVGKNWLTTIALPQYMVDQGLAEIVVMVFLENNHGKWLADMLFGQLQTKKRRSTLLSIDDLLSEFEAINRKSGRIRGFAVNPLSSIDFAKVFESLGYETAPPKEFRFIRRNIHFAAACGRDAKKNLPQDLMKLLGPALPDHEGMVRVSSSPPTNKPLHQLPFEERYVDVPAAKWSQSSIVDESNVTQMDLNNSKPLVVPLDRPFTPGGNGVVSQNTARRVGYNGLAFRKQRGNPELNQSSSKLVSQAWPRAMLNPFNEETDSGEPIYGTESVKCAPENWVVRTPVSYFSSGNQDWKARYPPKNMLNALYGKGPRVKDPWVPTQTYVEPPFPIIDGTAAKSAAQNINDEFCDIGNPVDTLDLLRAVFASMKDRSEGEDPWLQRKATVPSRDALDRYRKEIEVYNERWKGEPSPPKTIRQIFKEDPIVKAQVEELLAKEGEVGRGTKSKLFSKLFQEAEYRPGGLDRFRHLAALDQERFSDDLKSFQEKLKAYDRENGIPPGDELK